MTDATLNVNNNVDICLCNRSFPLSAYNCIREDQIRKKEEELVTREVALWEKELQ